MPGKEDAVVRGFLRFEPQSEQHHIHLRDLRQGVTAENEGVTAGDERIYGGRRFPEKGIEEARLQVDQPLVEVLTPRPAKDRHGKEAFAQGGVCRQTAAFAARVDDHPWLRPKPLVEGGIPLPAPELQQQVGGATTRAYLLAVRISRYKPFVFRQLRYGVKVRKHPGRYG